MLQWTNLFIFSTTCGYSILDFPHVVEKIINKKEESLYLLLFISNYYSQEYKKLNNILKLVNIIVLNNFYEINIIDKFIERYGYFNNE